MPTNVELESALRNAHSAGDMEAAKALANAIKALEGAEPEPEEKGKFEPTLDPSTEPTFEEMAATGLTPEQLAIEQARAQGLSRGEASREIEAAMAWPGYEQLGTFPQKQQELETYLSELPEGRRWLIEGMTPMEAFTVGMGEGVHKLGRGVGLAEQDPLIKESLGQLKKVSPGAFKSGEFTGEALTFAIPGAAAAKIPGTAARVATMAGLGGVEGFAIERGEGRGSGLLGGTIGAVTGGTLEFAMPVIIRSLKKYYADSGKLPSNADVTVDEYGNLTENAREMLRQAGQDPDQFVKEHIEGVVAKARAAQQGSALQKAELAQLVDLDPALIKAANDLGVDIPPGWATRNPDMREVYQGLASVSGTNLKAQERQAIEDLMAAADDILVDMGGTTKKAELSEAIRTNINQTIDGLKRDAENVYNELETLIPKKTLIKPEESAEAIRFLQNRSSELQGKLERGQQRILDLLQMKKGKKLTTGMVYETTRSGAPTYALLDRERKKIGEALGRSMKTNPYSSTETAELAQLYNLVTDVQNKVADRAGGEGASELWKIGKGMVSKRKELEEKTIAAIGADRMGDIIPPLGAATRKVATGNVRDFKKIVDTIPKEFRGAAVASALNDVFTGGARNVQLSRAQYVKWFEKLEPATKKEIFKHLPEGSFERMENLYKVSKAAVKATPDKIQTGLIQGFLERFDEPNGLVGRLYSGALRTADPATLGLASDLARSLKANRTTSLMAVDSFLSGAPFKNLMVQMARSTSGTAKDIAKAQIAERRLMRSLAYNEFFETLEPSAQRNIANLGFIAWLTGEDSEE